MRIEWSEQAVEDLKAISEYIEVDRSIEAANRVATRIYESIQNLALMPRLGRSGRLENTRELILPGLPYFVCYRVLDDRVEILNIVHGARRWP